MTILKDIGRLIAAQRVRSGYSQSELSRLCGLSSNYIGELENGKHEPRITTVIQISQCLNCSIIELIPKSVQVEPEKFPDDPDRVIPEKKQKTK